MSTRTITMSDAQIKALAKQLEKVSSSIIREIKEIQYPNDIKNHQKIYLTVSLRHIHQEKSSFKERVLTFMQMHTIKSPRNHPINHKIPIPNGIRSVAVMKSVPEIILDLSRFVQPM